MRALLVLPLVAATLALAPAVASDGYEYGDYCPQYDIHQDVGPAHIDASSHAQRPVGAFVLAFGGFYLIEDTAVANSLGEPYLFSFAFYEETGALPGLQRFDSVCVDCPDPTGWLCDLSWFY